MKILVTVGTSSFDSLMQACENDISGFDLLFQIGEGRYFPSSGIVVRYFDDFNRVVDDVDIIITHAGAGSVYDFLERGKKIIAIPNTDRVDCHQLELARYIEENNFSEVCYDLKKITESIDNLMIKAYHKYEKTDFFMGDFINEYIENS